MFSGNVVGEGKVFRFLWIWPFYTGPEYYAGIGTLMLVVAMSALFNVFTAPYFISTGVLAALVAVWIFQLVSISSIIVLITRDPGIVPRSVEYRDHFDPIRGINRSRPPPMAFENSIKTFPVRSKFCDTCGNVRAPRVVHCSADDVDLECFDHHCPWLGCCIAKRNYKYFLIFLFSLSLTCLGVLGVSIAHLSLYTLDDYNNTGQDNLARSIRASLAGNIPVAIVCGICVLFMWFIVGLTAYHVYLSSHAITTYEHIRGAYDTIGNPHDKGAWYRNIWAIFAEPIRPSWIDLKTRTRRIVLKPDSEEEIETQRRIGSLISEACRLDPAVDVREQNPSS
jgi:hypothetical protein